MKSPGYATLLLLALALSSSAQTLTPPDNGSDPNFTHDLMTFSEREGVEDGLGPTYNAQSCAECHAVPATGGSSQTTELRVGRSVHGVFVAPTINGIVGRSLVNDRAICPQAQETVPAKQNVKTTRLSLNLLGDGLVEAVADATFQDLAAKQKKQTNGQVRGEVVMVPVLEDPAQTLHVGRFGWKDQHASLQSFAADAYINEMGITSPLEPSDFTSTCDTTSDPEDDGSDITAFTAFMRGTQPVAPAASAGDVAAAGSQVFQKLGCAVCHVPSLTTAPAGTVINSNFTIPPQLGGQTFSPYGDFLLHDIGTGDGIVQNGPQDTADKVRTAPLWGLRFRTRLMHDGLSVTVQNAIERHDNEAQSARRAFDHLSQQQTQALLAFLGSL